jgi:3-dehydroquinate dehydratase-2
MQSNIEGEIVTIIQNSKNNFNGIIINAAAYTHTSVGIGDAIRSISSPVIEVHISNTYSREEYRHKSFLSAHVKGIILGFGLKSYDLAISSFLD